MLQAVQHWDLRALLKTAAVSLSTEQDTAVGTELFEWSINLQTSREPSTVPVLTKGRSSKPIINCINIFVVMASTQAEVLSLYIAVYDASSMGSCQGLQEVAEVATSVVGRHAAVCIQLLLYSTGCSAACHSSAATVRQSAGGMQPAL